MDQGQPISDELNSTCPLLAGVQRNTVFTVPAGYFDGLADRIMAKIRQDELEKEQLRNELKTIAPLLHSLKKKDVYTVPAGYFQQPLTVLTGQAGTREKGKLVLFSRKWKQYAAAAAMTGIMATGIFLYSNKEKDGAEYEKYVKLDLSSAIDNVSDTELVNYLEKNERLSVASEQPVAISTELPDVRKHIGLYSDEELKQYLNENADLELARENTGGE